MKTPSNRPSSLRAALHSAVLHDATLHNAALHTAPMDKDRFLWGANECVAMADLRQGTCLLGTGPDELAGRSVLLATHDQLSAALALIELDGIASRIIICPSDIQLDQFPAVIDKGGVDAIVSDHDLTGLQTPTSVMRVMCGPGITKPKAFIETEPQATEWVLLTSGTSGAPKMIAHTLESLTAPIAVASQYSANQSPAADRVVWGTFYDMRRYGGMQIFLRAILGTGSLVLSHAGEPVADHLTRLGTHGVTHLSGTPSHWRRALMSPEIHSIAPKYIRLSGEIADQAILNSLHSMFPESAIGHAFASTEAGVAFEVNDGLAGFPANMLDHPSETRAVEMKVENDSLLIRSQRNASRYMDAESGALAREDGFVDTGDIVERRGDRYYFLGRRNGVINVGGNKVYPEEVEAVINRHTAVRMSVVRARRSPITGALVTADVVLHEGRNGGNDFRAEILEICRHHLPAYKVPATIRFVASLEVAAAGKLVRSASPASSTVVIEPVPDEPVHG